MCDFPGYVWAMVLVGAIGIPAATSVALYRGAISAGFGRRGAAGVGAAAAVLLGAWMVASGVLARAGVYDRRELLSPLVIAAATTLVALLAATRIPAMSRVLGAPHTATRLALPHAFRIMGGRSWSYLPWATFRLSSPCLPALVTSPPERRHLSSRGGWPGVMAAPALSGSTRSASPTSSS